MPFGINKRPVLPRGGGGRLVSPPGQNPYYSASHSRPAYRAQRDRRNTMALQNVRTQQMGPTPQQTAFAAITPQQWAATPRYYGGSGPDEQGYTPGRADLYGGSGGYLRRQLRASGIWGGPSQVPGRREELARVRANTGRGRLGNPLLASGQRQATARQFGMADLPAGPQPSGAYRAGRGMSMMPPRMPYQSPQHTRNLAPNPGRQPLRPTQTGPVAQGLR